MSGAPLCTQHESKGDRESSNLLSKVEGYTWEGRLVFTYSAGTLHPALCPAQSRCAEAAN